MRHVPVTVWICLLLATGCGSPGPAGQPDAAPLGCTGACVPGASESEACGSDVGACVAGERQRTCGSDCQWPTWGACEGEVTAAVEACGDAIDNNCDGTTDEGCGCAPAAVGAAGSLPLAGPVSKLVADPSACYLYALAGDE